MGKSPGKWIKTLFGKKTIRSNSTEERNASKARKDKGYTAARVPPAPVEDSQVISEQALGSTKDNESKPEPEKGNTSTLSAVEPVISSSRHVADNQIATNALNDQDKIREEQAATKAQAAFRGFLARRAFLALKGIIRLQATIRGHLVRRQAVVTMYSLLGIVKLQALARGQNVRSSRLGQEIHTKLLRKNVVSKHAADSRKDKLYSNAFVCKLLSAGNVIMPLQIQYDQAEPNSVYNWIERWSISGFWKLPIQSEKEDDSKLQMKETSSTYTPDTESSKSKRNVKKSSLANNIDSMEIEKPKRNVRKVVASSDATQDNPQSELEKVKRNLRKVTSSYLDIAEKPEVKCEVQTDDGNKSSDSKGAEDYKEERKIDATPIHESNTTAETAYSAKVDELVFPLVEKQDAIEPNPLIVDEKKYKEENGVSCAEVNVKEEQNCHGSQKNNKRRSSFSSKSENEENGVQNSPTLPSYMQATASAKAKLKGHTSPVLGSESSEKNGVTRRHSLPSPVTGKVASHSPRTHRILQAGVKGGIKSDRSFSSSRDANDKPILVEWRR